MWVAVEAVIGQTMIDGPLDTAVEANNRAIGQLLPPRSRAPARPISCRATTLFGTTRTTKRGRHCGILCNHRGPQLTEQAFKKVRCSDPTRT